MKNTVFTILVGFIFLTGVNAADIYVPADYPTIQAGINAASEADTVWLADGTYTGAGNTYLIWGGKNITIRSESDDPSLCIIDCGATNSAIYLSSATSALSAIQGITIQNSYSSRGAIELRYDGGLLVSNCILTNNLGSAVVLRYGASIVMYDCDLTYNNGYVGGACFTSGPCSFHGERCLISNNTSTGNGGGFDFWDGGDGTLIDCVIRDNTSTGDEGGGIYAHNNAGLTLIGCQVSNNSATAGAGIYYSYSPGGLKTLTIDGCYITDNTSSSYHSGGVVMYNAGTASMPCQITNSIFSGNSSYYGSAIQAFSGTNYVNVMNCTVTDNTTTSGSAIRFEDPTGKTITNCIVWGNNTTGLHPTSGLNVTYSDIEGGYAGTGNIDQNPEFVGGGDYHLTSASLPVINTGTSIGAPLLDIDGDIRPLGAGVEMGADEIDIPPTPTPTLTPTVTPTETPTVTPTLTPTLTPTVTPTLTPTLTPTITPTMTPTATPEPIPSTGPAGIGLLILGMSCLMGLTCFRKK